jgi:hypothetical protein
MILAQVVKLVPGKLPTYVGNSLYNETWIITKLLDNGCYIISNPTIDMYVSGDQIAHIQ